ncbi:MAG: hypothetical protein LBL87_00700 [Ruminococcus sp.]|jgi:hypothetical protein|nr:hypothetical protein [Ruminococcus sp.]
MSGIGEDAASTVINSMMRSAESIGNMLMRILEMRIKAAQERQAAEGKTALLPSGKVSMEDLAKGAQLQKKELVRNDNFPTERLSALQEACKGYGIPMASVSLSGDNNCTVCCLSSDKSDFEKLMVQVMGEKIQDDPNYYAVKKNVLTQDNIFGTEQMLNRANIPAMTFKSADGGMVTLVPKEFEKEFDTVAAKAQIASDRVNDIAAVRLEGSYADFEAQLDNSYEKLDTAEAYGVQFQLGEIAEKGGNTQGIKVVQSGEDFYAVVPKGAEGKLSELRGSFKEAKAQTDGIRADFADGAVILGRENGTTAKIAVTDHKAFMNSATEANFAVTTPLAKHILCRDVAQRLPEKEREIFGYDLAKNRIPHENIRNIELLREVKVQSENITENAPDSKESVLLFYDKQREQLLAVNEKDFADDTLRAFSGLDRAFIPIAAEKIRAELDIEIERDNNVIDTQKLETDNPLLSGVEYVDTPKGVFIANKTENSVGFCELPDGITRDKAAEVITARLGIENPAAVNECLDKLKTAVAVAPAQSGLAKLISYGKEAYEKAQTAKAEKAAAKAEKSIDLTESPIGGAESVAR